MVEVWMSCSGSTVWEDEISDISLTSGATGEGITTTRLSTFQIDWVEDYVSSSYWTTSSERIEDEKFEERTL